MKSISAQVSIPEPSGAIPRDQQTNQRYKPSEIAQSLELIMTSISTIMAFDAAAIFVNSSRRGANCPTPQEDAFVADQLKNYTTDEAKADNGPRNGWKLYWEQRLFETEAPKENEHQHRYGFADATAPGRDVLAIPVAHLLDSPTLKYSPDGARSALTIPLRENGVSVAQLVLYKCQEHYFDAQHINQLDTYKPLLMMVLRNTAETILVPGQQTGDQTDGRGYLQVENVNEWHALSTISTELKKVDHPDDLAAIFLREVLILAGGLSSSIYRANHAAKQLEYWQSYPKEAGQPSTSSILEMHDGLLGAVIQGDEPLVFHWEQSKTADQSVPREAEQLGIQYSALLIPLSTNQGKLVGVMVIHLDEEQQITPGVFSTMKAISTMAADVLNRASTRDTLEQLVAERTHELQAANEQLRELDRLKNKFIQDMSHEFRTPLTSMGLYLNLLEKKSDNSTEPSRYIDALKRQTSQLSSLVNGILDIAIPDRITGLGDCDSVNIVDLIEELVSTKKPYAEANGLSLDFRSSTEAYALGNRGALRRMLSNLIDNAINYTPKGSISITLAERNDELHICVEDSGIGIPEADLDHIFERFYRGTDVGQLNIPGSGLGLSMVKQIVEQHDGCIEVESKIEKGTTFQVWLPLAKENGFVDGEDQEKSGMEAVPA